MRKFENLKVGARRLSLAVIVAVLVFGCKHKTGTGNTHLPQKQMQKVLLDMTLAEGYSTMNKDSLHKTSTKNYDSLAVYYKDIFAHHKITEEQFNESLDWYKGHPEEMDSTYAILMTSITRLQTKLPIKIKN
jgi:hypothetical protein